MVLNVLTIITAHQKKRRDSHTWPVSDFQKYARPKDVSGKIVFSPVKFKKIFNIAWIG